ncbi:unnamed protein product, partial [Arabidopsis halleri]
HHKDTNHRETKNREKETRVIECSVRDFSKFSILLFDFCFLYLYSLRFIFNFFEFHGFALISGSNLFDAWFVFSPTRSVMNGR